MYHNHNHFTITPLRNIIITIIMKIINNKYCCYHYFTNYIINYYQNQLALERYQFVLLTDTVLEISCIWLLLTWWLFIEDWCKRRYFVTCWYSICWDVDMSICWYVDINDMLILMICWYFDIKHMFILVDGST